MLDLYAVLGGAAVFVCVVALGFWVSKRLGAAEIRRREREEWAATQRRLAAILARRDRTRGELIDWMHDHDD